MIKPYWQKIINEEKQKDYFCQMMAEIEQQKSQNITIFPEQDVIFSAFEYQDLPDIKVVVLGQDPYHGVGTNLLGNEIPQAHGLAFSVQEGVKTPPSLVNIFKELVTDIENFSVPNHGNLTAWAKQGVLLLNTVLTVQQGQAHSHAKLGWEEFTNVIIEQINQHNNGCVFILWGAHAQKKAGQKGCNIDNKHHILVGPHPSPLSVYRGFWGCKHFSKTNTWLKDNNKQPINW